MHHPLRAHFPQIAVEYGRGSILKWRNAGVMHSANGDETSLVPNGTIRKEGNASKGRLLKELQDVERGIKRCLDFMTGATETLALCAINCGAWRLASETSMLI